MPGLESTNLWLTRTAWDSWSNGFRGTAILLESPSHSWPTFLCATARPGKREWQGTKNCIDLHLEPQFDLIQFNSNSVHILTAAGLGIYKLLFYWRLLMKSYWAKLEQKCYFLWCMNHLPLAHGAQLQPTKNAYQILWLFRSCPTEWQFQKLPLCQREQMCSPWGQRGDSASSKTVPEENTVAQATWNKSLDPGSYSTANTNT